MKLNIIIVVFVVLFLIACDIHTNAAVSSESANVAKSTQVEDLQAGDCELLAKKSFQSVEQHEVGRSPAGEVKGHWAIRFDEDQYRWRYSDVVEMGTYQCEAGVLTLIGPSGAPRATGQWMPEALKVMIDNVDYALQAK